MPCGPGLLARRRDRRIYRGGLILIFRDFDLCAAATRRQLQGPGLFSSVPIAIALSAPSRARTDGPERSNIRQRLGSEPGMAMPFSLHRPRCNL